MRGKSTSEHNLSGEGCNFRVSRVFFLGQTKSRVFQGLPGFVGHPVLTYMLLWWGKVADLRRHGWGKVLPDAIQSENTQGF